MKCLAELGEKALKERIKETIRKLPDYPLSLRELHVQTLEGAERTFRVKMGRYRSIFRADKKERTIIVTHLGKRESIHEN